MSNVMALYLGYLVPAEVRSHVILYGSSTPCTFHRTRLFRENIPKNHHLVVAIGEPKATLSAEWGGTQPIVRQSEFLRLAQYPNLEAGHNVTYCSFPLIHNPIGIFGSKKQD